MKKIFYFLFLISLTSCGAKTSDGPASQADSIRVADSIATAVNSSSSSGTSSSEDEQSSSSASEVTFDEAAIESEYFVKDKMKYPEEVEFDGDKRGHETSKNNFNVFQKFTAKNSFGVKSGYVYKICMVYKGTGDWTDLDNWSYSSLTIEDTSTGKQSVY
jgi:hypothetical protein